jgi:hypothetical protein
LSPVTSTTIRVGDSSWSAFGRKSAALAESTLTPVMSTPLGNTNSNPTKGSEHGSIPEQKGIGDRLTITILSSPTEIVDKLTAPSALSASTSQGSEVVQVTVGGEVAGTPNAGIQKDAATVFAARARGALAFINSAATIKEPKRIRPLHSQV